MYDDIKVQKRERMPRLRDTKEPRDHVRLLGIPLHSRQHPSLGFWYGNENQGFYTVHLRPIAS